MKVLVALASGSFDKPESWTAAQCAHALSRMVTPVKVFPSSEDSNTAYVVFEVSSPAELHGYKSRIQTALKANGWEKWSHLPIFGHDSTKLKIIERQSGHLFHLEVTTKKVEESGIYKF